MSAALGLALSACGGPQQISQSGYGAYEVSLASWGDSVLALAWYDTRDGNAEIYVRFIEGAGRPIDTDHRLTHTSDQSYEPDIVALDGGVAIAWYEKSRSEALRARVCAWDLGLEQKWCVPLGAEGAMTRNPVLRATADGLFVAWIERTSRDTEVVRAGWLSFNGAPRASPVTLGPASETTWNLNAAIDPSGNPFVAYDARVGTQADELYLAAVLPTGGKLTRITPDDGSDSKYPDIAFAENGSLALTWFDTRDGNEEIYLAIGAPEESLAHPVARASRVTETAGQSIGAYVAWNGSRVGLAWSDDSEGEHEIYFQSFDGGVATEAPRRITTNPTSSSIPAIKPWREGFELAWSELISGERGPHEPDTRSEVSAAFVP